MSGERSQTPGPAKHLARRPGLLADAFENAPTPLVRVAGPQHRFVAANAAYRELVGRSDLADQDPQHVLPGFTDRRQIEMLDRVFREGRAEHHRAWPATLPAEDPEGQSELFLDIAATPYLDSEHNVAGVDVSFVDVTELVEQRVTEQRRAQQLAHRARQQSAGAREQVVELQDSLLPDALPVLPMLEVSARYLLSADETAAGGDWFDTVVRDDGTVVLLVGDVVGHGVAASAAMGQLRAVLHQQLLTASVGESLAALDRFAGTGVDARAATVCVVQLDPRTGALEYCTAGHPAPLVVTRDGEARFLAPSGASPLATRGDFTVARADLARDELLLLYTDGIIERPGTPPTRSTLDLARVAGNAAQGREHTGHVADRVCDVVLGELVRASGFRDDVALLAARRTAPVAPVTMRLRADQSSVPAARARLADWLEELEVRPLDELCVQHAVGELVSNAVEHAYPAGTLGSVTVVADVDSAGHLQVSVSDHGRWGAGGVYQPHRGNGLAMVREFVDHLELHCGEHGTVATIRHRLTRPAQLLQADPETHRRTYGEPFHVTSTREDGHVVVSGAVDVSTADSLRHSLLQSSRGGTSDLVVDLAGVTLLASAGVQVLAEITGLFDGIELQAPMGSVAQHVLETVRLPYRLLASDPRR